MSQRLKDALINLAIGVVIAAGLMAIAYFMSLATFGPR